MPYVLAQHEVKDFDAWKAVFDSALELRRQHGETSVQVFTSADDPNSVTMIFGWDTLENAENYFFNTPELKAKMQEAGVLGPPTITMLNER